MELIHGSDYERDDRKLDNEHLLPRYLIGKPVLNACVQQYLMRYFHLAPRNFHLYPPIVFWGTIYKNESGTLWVSCLDSTENGFREYSLRVNESMDFRQSAALKAI